MAVRMTETEAISNQDVDDDMVMGEEGPSGVLPQPSRSGGTSAGGRGVSDGVWAADGDVGYDDDEVDQAEQDLYQEAALDVFHESRREEEEEADAFGGQPSSFSGQGTGAGSGEVGFTARTKALVRQLEKILQQQQQHPQHPHKKKPKLAAGHDGVTGIPLSEGAAPKTVSFLKQLLPTDGGRERRTQAAREAAQQLHRRQAAQTFYDLLVLQNRGYVQLDQSGEGAYGDLVIVPCGPLLMGVGEGKA